MREDTAKPVTSATAMQINKSRVFIHQSSKENLGIKIEMKQGSVRVKSIDPDRLAAKARTKHRCFIIKTSRDGELN